MAGGYRPGAGRPKGSTKRPQIRDFLTEEDVVAIVAKAKERADEGDSVMLKVLIEQIFGKAAQPVDLTSDGEPVQIVGFNFIRNGGDTPDNTPHA